MAIFPNFFIQAIQRRKMSFTIFQKKKKRFQVIKRKSSKSRKIDIFPKGLTHRFGPKMAIYPNSFYKAIQPRKMFFTIFQNKKKPFQAIKTRSSKRRNIDINSWFWFKNGHFSKLSFLGNIGNGKCLLRYSRTKKTLSKLQKQEVQKVEKLRFFQRG